MNTTSNGDRKSSDFDLLDLLISKIPEKVDISPEDAESDSDITQSVDSQRSSGCKRTYVISDIKGAIVLANILHTCNQ